MIHRSHEEFEWLNFRLQHDVVKHCFGVFHCLEFDQNARIVSCDSGVVLDVIKFQNE